jgi:hypothetical protein
MSRGYGYVAGTGQGNLEMVEHSEGMDEEGAVAIPRFLGGRPCLCRLRTMSFWPQWQALICTDRMPGFMRANKPSNPVTTLPNHLTLLRGGLLEGE